MATQSGKASDRQDVPFFRIEDNVLIGMDENHDECTNIGQLLLDKLKSKPDFVGQVDDTSGRKSTYAEMKDGSVKCALWLKKHGVQPGDKIGIWTENHLETYVPVFASLYVAGVICPWDHDASKISAQYCLSLMPPKVVFVNAASAENLVEAAKEKGLEITVVVIGNLPGFVTLTDILQEQISRAEIDEFRCTKIRNPDDLAIICSSSGTTGMPKGTELSYASLYNSVTPIEEVNVKNEVSLWTPTIRWHYGLALTIEVVFSDSKKIIMKDTVNDAQICEIIRKHGITWFGCDTSIPMRFFKYNILEKYPVPSLRKLVISGAPFTKKMQEAVRKIMPNTQVLQCYGMTDAGGLCAGQTKSSKAGSSGFIARGTRLKVVDQKTGKALGPNEKGELWIKSEFIMKGYHNNPQESKNAVDSDGWLHTKDIFYYDEEGEIYFVTRISDFINYKSINLSPAEIEGVLELHPSVLKAAVIPIPHDTDVEHPMAFIEKVVGKEVSAEELYDLVKDNLPWYCELRGGIKFIDKILQTSTGKIDKKQLKLLAQSHTS